MAANVATLKLRIQTDASGTVKVLDSVGSASRKAGDDGTKSFSRMDKAGKNLTGTLVKMGAALGGLYALKKAMDFSMETIALASDLEETQGKFDVVFRGMTATAETWAQGLRDNYAMAETESKRYLSSIQDLLVPTGMLRTEAGALSNEFVKMAADLGSFNNRATENVIMDIQSALQGSSETMAKYGINVKAAKVEQEILNSGLAQSKADITDAHKAQAIYNIMMRDGADAVGDMARTSDSYANQLKKAEANAADLKTEIGKNLIPVVNGMFKAFNQLNDTHDTIQGTAVAMTYLIDAGAGIKREFQVAGRAIAVVLQSLELGMWQLADVVYNGPIRALNAIIDLANRIPMLDDIEGLPLTNFGQEIYENMRRAEAAVNAGIGDIADILTAPLPGSAIRAELAKTGTQAEDTAGAVEDAVEQMADDIKTLTPKSGLIVKGNWFAEEVEKPAKEAAVVAETAADAVETAWTRAAENIQDAWAGFLTDVITGEFDGVEGLLSEISRSLASSVSNNLIATLTTSLSSGAPLMGGAVEPGTGATSSFMSGGIGAAMGAVNPWMLAGGIGLSVASSFLGKDDEPSFGEQMGDAIRDLIDALDRTTKSIMQQVDGLSDFEIAVEDMVAGIMTDGVFKNRTLAGNFAFPAAGNIPTSGPMAGQIVSTKSIMSTPEDSEGFLNELFDQKSMMEFYTLMQNTVSGGDALFQNMRDILGFSELSAEEWGKIVYDMTHGSKGKQSRTTAEGIVAVMDEAFAQIRLIGKDAADELTGYAEDIARGNMTEYNRTLAEIDDRYDPLIEQSDKYLSTLEDIYNAMTAAEKASDSGRALAEQIAVLGNAAQYEADAIADANQKFADERQKITGQMTDDIAIAAGDMSAYQVALQNIKDKSDAYYDSLIDNGMDLDTARTAADDYTGGMTRAYFDDLLSEPLTGAEQVEKNFTDIKDALRDAGLWAEYAADWQSAYNRELENIGGSNHAALIRGASDLAFSMTGDKDILVDQLQALSDDLTEADTGSAQLSILNDQYAILQRIYDVEASALQEQINSVTGINDAITRLQGGMITPQSMDFFEGRYDQLLADAMTGNSAAVTDLLNFVTQYQEFADAYGTDINALTESIVTDLELVRDEISGGATLSDLNDQLSDIRDNTAAILGLSTGMEDIKAGLRDIILEAGGTPSFATGGDHFGGLRIVGEQGWEMEATGPSRIHSSEDLASILATAMRSAIVDAMGPAGSDTPTAPSQINLTVNGRVLGEVVADLINTHNEVGRSIDKRIHKIRRAS